VSERAAWPAEVFEAPLLRGLDGAARALLSAAGRLHTLPPAHALFDADDRGDGFFVVVRGAVELHSSCEGAATHDTVRRLEAGESFGEEASLGLPRRARAVTTTSTLVAEIPTALFRRGAGRSERSGAQRLWDRELRTLRRVATRDLLQESLLGGLGPDDLDRLLDAARHETHARGDQIFEVGASATEAYLVADGLVALQTVAGKGTDDAVTVHGHRGRGDLFGDTECANGRYTVRAVAMGATRVMAVPSAVLHGVLARNPQLHARVRRMADERRASRAGVVAQAALRTTRHAFQDLYRMQVARSLLVIDQDTCVRCGHCAWSCAQVHGTSRLVRRGETVVARLTHTLDDGPRSLLLPNACQHCTDPVCMTDCPTGAIERGQAGEVFITDALCTGCGNCAKACPWENIRLAPRPALKETGSEGSVTLGPDVAIKCDLCRDYDGPACVRGCPTASIMRIDPSRELVEVAEVSRSPAAVAAQPPARDGRGSRALASGLAAVALCCVAAIALGLAAWGLRNHEAGLWSPGVGPGADAGWVALVALVGLLGHAIPKRCVKLWTRRRETSTARPTHVRSLVRPFVRVHVGLGVVGLAAAIMHAGPRMPSGVAGSLYLTWLMLCGLGLWGAFAYRVLPAALGRLEREGALPEDLPRRREALVDRMHRELSGRSDLVKTVADRVLLPYARAPWGALALVLCRRSLAAEQARLRGRVAAMLQGRGADKLHGVDALIRTVVEQRALPARRLLHAALRGWLLPHIMLTGIVVVLAVVHVVAMGGR
jgi:Fe-S-cluster-containing dehydrogenase component/CRP-like cAMP-binding protein